MGSAHSLTELLLAWVRRLREKLEVQANLHPKMSLDMLGQTSLCLICPCPLLRSFGTPCLKLLAIVRVESTQDHNTDLLTLSRTFKPFHILHGYESQPS